MYHKEPTYIRKGRVIRSVDPKMQSEEYKSISQAKRRSRELQQVQGGGLGNGFLRVERA
jgi:hypothetical protein